MVYPVKDNSVQTLGTFNFVKGQITFPTIQIHRMPILPKKLYFAKTQEKEQSKMLLLKFPALGIAISDIENN